MSESKHGCVLCGQKCAPFTDELDRRIAACINGCSGIPTDALEQGAIGDAIDTLLVILAAQPHWDGVRKVLRKMGRVP